MEAFLDAVATMGTSTYWIALLVAISVGTVVGFIPGVGATLVTAIMLPTVLLLIDDPAIGIMLLAMVGSLNNTLDSIPAVLIGLPGSETQVTYLEGHQLARQGLAAHTLGAVYAVSAIGGVFGAFLLALTIPIIKPFILQFSYVEIAMLALFGIAMVALLSRGSMAKGLAVGAFGLLLGTVGVDPFSGADRYTFGWIQLWQGLPVITVILGFFALPELIDLTMTRQAVASKDATVSRAEVFRGARHGVSRWPMVLRQSAFGAFMGAIPGIGGAVIDWLSYAFGISLSKDKEKHNFGKGSLEGVMFAESANNAKAGGQALPTLTLGIPGSTSWAIIAVAILAYGYAPGPSMVTQHADVTNLMIITLALGNVIVAIIGLFATNWLARITRIPYPTVGFMIMGMVILAAYLDLNSWMIFPIMMAFTALGLMMKWYGWPRPPLILGFILGPIVERNMLSGLSLYGFRGVISRPIAIGIFIALIVTITTLLRMTKTKPEALGQAAENVGVDLDGTPTHDADGSELAHDPAEGVVLTDEPTPAPSAGTRFLRAVFNRENVAPVFFIAIAGGFAINALGFPTTARTIPLATSLTVVAFSLWVLLKNMIKGVGVKGEIMDLGMASADMEGTGKAAAMIAGVLLGTILIAGIFGLRVAPIFLAAVGPIMFLQGRQRWLSAALSATAVFCFQQFLMNDLMGIIWPTPFLLPLFGLA